MFHGASSATSTSRSRSPDAGAEDRDDLGVLVAGIEGGVHDAAGNEGGVAGAEDALLPVDPLLDLAGDDQDHLLLVGVLVEVVALAGGEVDVDDRQLPRRRWSAGC